MKILFITNTCKGGGATIALANNVHGLLQKGHTIYVLTNGNCGELYDLLDKAAVVFCSKYTPTTYPQDRNPLKYIYGLFLHLFWWRSTKKVIERIITDNKIDIVHTNVGPMDLSLDICHRNRIPHVWHQREFFDLYSRASFFPYNKRFYSRIRKYNNYNICITKQVYDHCHLDGYDKACVIYDGVFSEKDVESFPAVEKENYFLFVGRIEKNKGVDELIEAFADFYKKNCDYKLLIAGKYSELDSYYKYCRNKSQELDVDHHIAFLGERKDIYTLMSKARAVVVCSHFEGFGFITAEAMINGTVVIGKNTSGTKEQFDLGLEKIGKEIGLRYNSLEDLSNNLSVAVNNDLLEMRRRAFCVVKEMYTNERCVDEIEKVYNKVIKDNS